MRKLDRYVHWFVKTFIDFSDDEPIHIQVSDDGMKVSGARRQFFLIGSIVLLAIILLMLLVWG